MRFPKTLTACCMLAAASATVTFAQDSDAQQKALDALRQFTAEKEGRASKGLTTEPVKPSDDAAAKELEEKARQAVREEQAQPAPTEAVSESEQDRRTREALDQLRRDQAAQQESASTAVIAGTPADDKEAELRKALEASYSSAPSESATAPTSAQGAQPLAAKAAQPAVMAKPKPKTKTEKLNDLLELYMDNTITPREYHSQRAEIVAGN